VVGITVGSREEVLREEYCDKRLRKNVNKYNNTKKKNNNNGLQSKLHKYSKPEYYNSNKIQKPIAKHYFESHRI